MASLEEVVRRVVREEMGESKPKPSNTNEKKTKKKKTERARKSSATYSDDEITTARYLYQECGLPTREIANILGRTPGALSVKFHLAGIKKSKEVVVAPKPTGLYDENLRLTRFSAAIFKSHRIAAGLTQAELAEESGVKIECIRGLESGTFVGPYKGAVPRLCNVLGVTINDLRTGF